MKALTEAEITKRIETLEGWEYQENALHTSLEFATFKDVISMMTRIAFEVEKLDHHPDWTNIYNALHISLYTHDAGGVTEKDFELANVINQVVY